MCSRFFYGLLCAGVIAIAAGWAASAGLLR